MPNRLKWLRVLHGVKLYSEVKARMREVGGRQSHRYRCRVLVVVEDRGRKGCKISLDRR